MEYSLILAVIVILSLVAGVYNKLSNISLSIVLIPGLLGFVNFLPINVDDVLLVLIATTLCASLPFSVLYFINAAKIHAEALSSLSKVATKIALLSILTSQVLGVISAIIVFYLYCSILLMFVFVLVYNALSSKFGFVWDLKHKKQSSLIYYSGLMSVVIGGIGSEWNKAFDMQKSNGNITSGFAFISLFVALPACLGFIFPGLPVPLVEMNSDLSVWMLGYVCWPISLIIFSCATVGKLLVKHHQNLTDIAWLDHILIIYIIASVVRLVLS